MPDTPAAVYLCIDGDVQTASTKFLAQYRTITSTAQDDQLLEETITSDQLGKPIFLRNLLLNQNGRGNTLTIRCQRTAGSVTYYQEYIVTLRRTLSLRERGVFLARYFYVDPLADVARQYGTSIGAVKSLLYRTRQGLRAHLEQEGFTV